jgi:tetratricopeptide (TPR) repeat protein
VAPTVSALMGLPVDRRLTGSVIKGAFTSIPAPPKKDLFGSVAVRRIQADALSEKDASEYAQRLRSLGYLSGGEPEKLAPTGGSRPGLTEGGWNNLGVFYREKGTDLPAAEAAFQKALSLRPAYASPQFNLAVLYRMRGEDRKAVEWLFRSLEAGHADPEGTTLRWFAEYEEGGKVGPAKEVLERGTARYPSNEAMGRELGLLRLAKDCEGAAKAVERFEASTREPDTLNAIALFQTCLGHRDRALSVFQKSLAMKPDQPGVLQSVRLLEKASPQGQLPSGKE